LIEIATTQDTLGIETESVDAREHPCMKCPTDKEKKEILNGDSIPIVASAKEQQEYET
jgi:hypothetical protein